MKGQRTRLILFQEDDGTIPLLDWLDGLTTKARAKCQVRLERPGELGHELRRPEADYLEDGIYELRARQTGVNYRILYFFFAREAVVVSHGIMKQQAAVPSQEIKLARRRKRLFDANPKRHTYSLPEEAKTTHGLPGGAKTNHGLPGGAKRNHKEAS